MWLIFLGTIRTIEILYLKTKLGVDAMPDKFIGLHLRDIIIIKYILMLFVLFFSITSAANESDVSKFNSVRSIYGFKITDAKISEVFENFGLVAPNFHAEKHELAEACIRNPESSFGLVLITGVIHDYETLYGYRLTKTPKNDCYISTTIKPEGSGEIVLGSRGSKGVDVLGTPKEISIERIAWKLEAHIPWDEPVVMSRRAGPNDRKYTQVKTVSGEYHMVLINAKFDGDSLSDFEIIDYAESDFSIVNVYDK